VGRAAGAGATPGGLEQFEILLWDRVKGRLHVGRAAGAGATPGGLEQFEILQVDESPGSAGKAGGKRGD
jgi:hypothetical protein